MRRERCATGVGVMNADVSVTRIINPSALIEIDDVAVLTDPYFNDSRFFPMNEPIGLRPADLPRLAMILGGHGVFDHWRPKSMMSYRYHDETPVFTANLNVWHARLRKLGSLKRHTCNGAIGARSLPTSRSHRFQARACLRDVADKQLPDRSSGRVGVRWDRGVQPRTDPRMRTLPQRRRRRPSYRRVDNRQQADS